MGSGVKVAIWWASYDSVSRTWVVVRGEFGRQLETLDLGPGRVKLAFLQVTPDSVRRADVRDP